MHCSSFLVTLSRVYLFLLILGLYFSTMIYFCFSFIFLENPFIVPILKCAPKRWLSLLCVFTVTVYLNTHALTHFETFLENTHFLFPTAITC